MLCRNKSPFSFYIVQYVFFKEFKHMFIGENPKRIIQKDEEFLKGKGISIKDENHTYI
jgi:hypothetical protein